MPDYITLTCPSCGGKLNITNDMQRFACSYCGKELNFHDKNVRAGIFNV
jgi:predicted RNA-binding Zn-ribbon protein involved in translation (DUF1610 family)